MVDNQKITLGDIIDYLGDEVVEIDVQNLISSTTPMSAPPWKVERIRNSDTKYPIIVAKSNKNYSTVIDGNHRLTKAYICGYTTIGAKILDLDSIDTPEVFKRIFRREK